MDDVLYVSFSFCRHINGPRTAAIPLTEEERQAIELSEQTAPIVSTTGHQAINSYTIGQDEGGNPIDIHLVSYSFLSAGAYSDTIVNGDSKMSLKAVFNYNDYFDMISPMQLWLLA